MGRFDINIISAFGATLPNMHMRIHLDNVIDGEGCDTGGDYYNPTTIDTRENDCDRISNPASKCMHGDLSGKHGLLDIPATNVVLHDDDLTMNDILEDPSSFLIAMEM